MTRPTITLYVDPGPDVTEPLGEALRAFNESRIGPYRRETLAVLARDERGDLVGGIQGTVLFGWLHVELLWVGEEHRGEGLGGTLLARMESAALERGARRAALLTTTWQAPGFYRKHGYEVKASFHLSVGSLPDEEEVADFLFVKRLERSDGSREDGNAVRE